MQAADGHVENFLFNSKDVDDLKRSLRQGDEVEFNILLKKRTGKKRATRIVVTQPAPGTIVASHSESPKKSLKLELYAA